MGFPLVEGWRFGGRRRYCADLGCEPILFSRQVQPAYICLPSHIAECRVRSAEFEICHRLVSPLCIPHSALRIQNGCQAWTRTKTSGLTNRRATLTLPGKSMALPAGLPPASFRLEDGRLVCSATAAIQRGTRNAERGITGAQAFHLVLAHGHQPRTQAECVRCDATR